MNCERTVIALGAALRPVPPNQLISEGTPLPFHRGTQHEKLANTKALKGMIKLFSTKRESMDFWLVGTP